MTGRTLLLALLPALGLSLLLIEQDRQAQTTDEAEELPPRRLGEDPRERIKVCGVHQHSSEDPGEQVMATHDESVRRACQW
jgi:hypothetical protein